MNYSNPFITGLAIFQSVNIKFPTKKFHFFFSAFYLKALIFGIRKIFKSIHFVNFVLSNQFF